MGERSEIGLRFGDPLSGGLLQPHPRLHGVRLAGDPAGEITAEHQLGLAVAEIGGGAEPVLGGRPVLGKIVAAGVERAQCEHRAAVTLAAAVSNSARAAAGSRGPPRPLTSISASATWASAMPASAAREYQARAASRSGTTPRPAASIRPYMYCASATPSAARRNHCAACCSSRSMPRPLSRQTPRLKAATRSLEAAASRIRARPAPGLPQALSTHFGDRRDADQYRAVTIGVTNLSAPTNCNGVEPGEHGLAGAAGQHHQRDDRPGEPRRVSLGAATASTALSGLTMLSYYLTAVEALTLGARFTVGCYAFAGELQASALCSDPV